MIDRVGWAGIGLTAATALTAAASIIMLSGRTFTADRERRLQRAGQRR